MKRGRIGGVAPEQQREVAFGSARLTYALVRADTERLTIIVQPDQSVRVTAPATADPIAVDARVRRRLPWVLRHQRALAAPGPQPGDRQYLSGESFVYLGRQYRLRVRRGHGAPSTNLQPPFLTTRVPNGSGPGAVADAVRRWYRERAGIELADRLAAVQRRSPTLFDRSFRLRVRPMSRRWGSCTARGTITLNSDLVQFPRGCIDYVIIHELCHLRVMRHGPRFEALLARHLPRWRVWRERLASHA